MISVSGTGGEFRALGYAATRRIISEPLRSFLYDYVTRLVDSGLLSTSDPDVPNTPNSYGDPFMEALLEALSSDCRQSYRSFRQANLFVLSSLQEG